MELQSRINDLRRTPVAAQKLYIEGQSTDGAGAPLEVTSPIDGSRLTSLEGASVADVDRAVASARAAFDDGRWRKQPPAAKKKVLTRLAELIEAQATELAVLGVRDNGTEFGMALKGEPGSAAGTIRYYAEALDKVTGEVTTTPDGVLGLVHRGPVGVVGAIVPWNFPMMIAAWKIGPALAAGNSVVLKPAETASLSLLRLAELAVEAGLPPGVLNIVTGDGAVTGDALARHMDVDVMVFTGSGATGRRLLEASAQSNLKRVYLELGGKSPNIVFADCEDLGAAAKMAANGIFRNSGQVCVAGSRLLVEASIHDEFVGMVAMAAEAMKVGDPLDLSNAIGAVNSEVQLSGVMDKVARAKADGVDVVTGSERILESTGGTYLQPTILTGVRPDMAVFQEEVFGPVLTVTPFSDEEAALKLANDSIYGLAAGVWTSNLGRAHRMIDGIESGTVYVNTYGGADNTLPLGGHKQSGNGHDKSMHAFEKYQNLKTAWIAL